MPRKLGSRDRVCQARRRPITRKEAGRKAAVMLAAYERALAKEEAAKTLTGLKPPPLLRHKNYSGKNNLPQRNGEHYEQDRESVGARGRRPRNEKD
jgi:hypothetical protein